MTTLAISETEIARHLFGDDDEDAVGRVCRHLTQNLADEAKNTPLLTWYFLPPQTRPEQPAMAMCRTCLVWHLDQGATPRVAA